MPSVDICYMAESPPCRAVEMVATISGVTLNKRIVDLRLKEQFSEENSKINPYRKIPLLIDGELKINESRAIMAYLVDRYMPEDNTLYPKDLIKRAQVNELLFMDIGFLMQSTIQLFRPILFGLAKESDPDAEKAFRETLQYFDNRLKKGGKKFFLGDNLTIADVSIAASLTFTVPFDFEISEFRHLSAYFERLKASIPKYQEINEKPLENFKKFVQFNQAKLREGEDDE